VSARVSLDELLACLDRPGDAVRVSRHPAGCGCAGCELDPIAYDDDDDDD